MLALCLGRVAGDDAVSGDKQSAVSRLLDTAMPILARAQGEVEGGRGGAIGEDGHGDRDRSETKKRAWGRLELLRELQALEGRLVQARAAGGEAAVVKLESELKLPPLKTRLGYARARVMWMFFHLE